MSIQVLIFTLAFPDFILGVIYSQEGEEATTRKVY